MNTEDLHFGSAWKWWLAIFGGIVLGVMAFTLLWVFVKPWWDYNPSGGMFPFTNGQCLVLGIFISLGGLGVVANSVRNS